MNKHREMIRSNFIVLAETENAILFDAYGEICCEINGAEFSCSGVEEFYEMVELFGDDSFEEQSPTRPAARNFFKKNFKKGVDKKKIVWYNLIK